MYRYLFTNDLRISVLDSSLKDAANKFIANTVPSASVDKSANNNINTLGFYFNLTQESNCAQIASEGNIRKVVLNFIKKFQFPNPRTFEAYNNSNEDGIKIAPMRLILKLLYIMSMNEGSTAHLTKNEIENFIFYNSKSTEKFNPNLLEIYSMITEYRKTNTFPDSVEIRQEQKIWNQGDRQLREMIKVLTWSGCVVETDDGKIKISHTSLSEQNKADIFEIVNYNGFWNGRYPYTNEEKVQIKESYQSYMDISNDEIVVTEECESLSTVGKGGNVLIYGVPGCGKSHYIKEKYTLNDENSERVVFHPDYTYSDFVGQILPKLNPSTGSLSYEFVEGPFTRLLMKCNLEVNTMHYLVIEEINRGNAPAIFGEIFQLLDRDVNGVSEYGISNTDIAEKIFGDKNIKIKIPSNLTILATMNTADQNVFTLDTAFKRRWEMLSIRNNFKLKEENLAEDIEFNNQLNHKLFNSNIDWKSFAVAINKVIIEESESNLGNEDKRLGHFFIKQSEMSDISKFSEKVIMYLWNDVFKFDKDKVFNAKYKTLEDILDAFADEQVGFNVFNESLGFKNILIEAPQEDVPNGEVDDE